MLEKGNVILSSSMSQSKKKEIGLIEFGHFFKHLDNTMLELNAEIQITQFSKFDTA